MHRLLIALSFCAACTATVRTAPPPAEPAGPPPAPPPQPVATQPAPPPPPPAPPPAPAPAAEHHAAYLSAVQDLRHARALLARKAGGPGDVKWDEKTATKEIDFAIRELHEAKLDVGATPEEPTIDARMMYRDRLREATLKLDDATRNLSEQEDNEMAFKRGKEALQHIYAAKRAVDAAIGDRKDDKAEKKEDKAEKKEEKAEKKEEKREEKAEKKAAKGH